MTRLYPLLLLVLIALPPALSAQAYIDPALGRDPYALSEETVNEARLYDFYQRQADHHMGNREAMPEVLPAYPGLDAAKHGHWGKHNQNNHSDARWNESEMGEVFTQVTRHGKDFVVLKGINLRLGDEREISACFDPLTLSYRAIWEGGFISFDGFRWGTSRNAQIQGEVLYRATAAEPPAEFQYLGFHRFGKRVVFGYRIGEVRIQDEPWGQAGAFYRKIDLDGEADELTLQIPAGDGLSAEVIASSGLAEPEIDGAQLTLRKVQPGASVTLRIAKDGATPDDAAALAHLGAERVPSRRWNEQIAAPGTLGTPVGDSAYAIDTIPVPYDNPWRVVMQLSGIGILPNGDALVSTLVGDIWRVSGVRDGLDDLVWSRFATGLNQPIGIHIDDSGIYVLDRGQLYRLHDENGDGEADFYENYANDFGGYDRSHTHTFGLHRTADGSFHFTQRESIFRTGPDQKTVLQGVGVRNCMGIGGSADYFWVAPQEGTWTPASAIIEVHEGEFYGLPPKGSAERPNDIMPALCYIPRGIDNSTGGMVEISSTKWGPLGGNHVGLSYGANTHYLILRDDSAVRPQGAVVPLEGEFLSGAMRGVFHRDDGQLYLVGLDGWGDYSTHDGCFHRVRYTGAPVYKPSGFQVHANGIRIDFPVPLDEGAAEDVSNYFAQVWNYEYAKRYGSPEFSAAKPDAVGHDPLAVRSVTLLAHGRSIFVEIPDLRPVMQLHLRMHLEAEDGHAFETDLFVSPMYQDPPYQAEGLAPPVADKPTSIALRIVGSTPADQIPVETGEAVEGERAVLVRAIGGLQYEQTELTARPGEALALTLENTDVMPHNLVIVAPGAIEKVGEASFKMLSDPKAGEKNYVPELDEVLAVIPVIDPGAQHVLHFRAPQEPGEYPYICTFPGHWQAMRGVLRVE